MKKYEMFAKDPVKLADYITEKLEGALKTICYKTGNRFYHSNSEYNAVKGIIISELFEDVKDE